MSIQETTDGGVPEQAAPSAKPPPSLRHCCSLGEGFMFGHLLFDPDVRPALHVLFPPGAARTPDSLHLSSDGNVIVTWLDGGVTDLGVMHKAMIRAYRRHGSVNVETAEVDATASQRFLMQVKRLR